jgi:hypothetical protein
MAKIQVQLHWDADGKTVEKTYQVLSTEPNDTITFITTDPAPFIIESPNAELAKKLGLEKEKPVDSLNDLYLVKKVTDEATKTPPPVENAEAPWLELKCGTIEGGHYVNWGGVAPELKKKKP